MLQKKSKKIHKKSSVPFKEQNSDLFKFDFDELAIFHSPLSKYVFFSSQGVSTIDWKDPKALKELNKAILLCKFQIKYWDIPSNFLCPTIPSRLNYLQWISDLLINKSAKEIKGLKGLDIGTGASLIYPLLGFKVFGWKFLGTEINPVAFDNAAEIIKNNSLESFIQLRISEGGIYKGVIKKKEDFFAFSMCNPPFFENLEERKEVDWRKSELNEYEGEYLGGEVGFIRKMIEESEDFKENVGFFTSLVGKKRDFELLLKELYEKKKSVKGFEIYSKSFFIGKNARWAIAWKFNQKN